MVEFVPIKDAKGEEFEIMEWIPRMAKEYGWTSEAADETMAEAIDKAGDDASCGRAPGVDWGLAQSLAGSRFSYEAMMFCRGERDPDVIHAGGAYEGEDILAVRKPGLSTLDLQVPRPSRKAKIKMNVLGWLEKEKRMKEYRLTLLDLQEEQSRIEKDLYVYRPKEYVEDVVKFLLEYEDELRAWFDGNFCGPLRLCVEDWLETCD